jgi:hypothetical protein
VRLIADGGFSHIKLLHFAKSLDITHIGRLQINAGLYDEPGEQPSNKRGPKPTKGDRQQELKQYLEDPETEWKSVELPIYEGKTRSIQYISGVSLWYVKGNAPILLRWVLIPPSQEKDQPSAFFSTDINMKPEEILSLYADRWNIEVFFEEVRACMGYETQRGWTNRTIGRTTPCLFGVFSLVVLLAKRLFPNELPIRQAAWYTKKHATFRDVLAAVREHLWENGFAGFEHKITQNNKGESPFDAEYRLIPAHLFVAMQEMACYAA